MNKKQPTTSKNYIINKEKSVKDLVKRNPDVSLARQIMEQKRKTKKHSVTIDQSNYYKLPSAS